MSIGPKQEGARWGEDPPPPGPDPLSERLRGEFGEANMTKALSIGTKLKTDYPYLAILQRGALEFAGEVLNCAQRAVRDAAADGRRHSVPETLEALEKTLGGYLIEHPDTTSLASFNFRYGDESEGRAAKAPRPTRTKERAGIMMFHPLMKYFVFKGRARRAELWQFVALISGTSTISVMIDDAVGPNVVTTVLMFVAAVSGPALFAVLVRRTHDVGLDFLGNGDAAWFHEGTYGPNKHGPDPKGTPLP